MWLVDSVLADSVIRLILIQMKIAASNVAFYLMLLNWFDSRDELHPNRCQQNRCHVYHLVLRWLSDPMHSMGAYSNWESAVCVNVCPVWPLTLWSYWLSLFPLAKFAITTDYCWDLKNWNEIFMFIKLFQNRINVKNCVICSYCFSNRLMHLWLVCRVAACCALNSSRILWLVIGIMRQMLHYSNSSCPVNWLESAQLPWLHSSV